MHSYQVPTWIQEELRRVSMNAHCAWSQGVRQGIYKGKYSTHDSKAQARHWRDIKTLLNPSMHDLSSNKTSKDQEILFCWRGKGARAIGKTVESGLRNGQCLVKWWIKWEGGREERKLAIEYSREKRKRREKTSSRHRSKRWSREVYDAEALALVYDNRACRVQLEGLDLGAALEGWL